MMLFQDLNGQAEGRRVLAFGHGILIITAAQQPLILLFLVLTEVNPSICAAADVFVCV
jgi:hypothetical protein